MSSWRVIDVPHAIDDLTELRIVAHAAGEPERPVDRVAYVAGPVSGVALTTARQRAAVLAAAPELWRVLAALVASAPQCRACDQPAVCEDTVDRGAPYCDEHAPEWYPESAWYPRAVPLREALALLGRLAGGGA